MPAPAAPTAPLKKRCRHTRKETWFSDDDIHVCCPDCGKVLEGRSHKEMRKLEASHT